MHIRPFADLLQYAREVYRKRYAEAPEPRVVNLDAVVQFGQSRDFDWNGVHYRAPPLSYRAGLRLLIAANALRDLREASSPHPSALAYAHRTAAACIRQAVRPVGLWARRVWAPALRPFLAADPLEVEGLCRWLHGVPDESAPPPPPEPGDRRALDLMDALAGFARDFPAWTGPDGLPLSWAHYSHGQRHLGRARHREDLREAIAVRAAGSDVKPYREWAAEWRAAAGW